MANPTMQLYVGKAAFIEHEIRDTSDRIVDGTATTWATSDNTKVSLGSKTQKGQTINGVAPGTSTVTATNGSDTSAVDVTVVALPSNTNRKMTLKLP